MAQPVAAMPQLRPPNSSRGGRPARSLDACGARFLRSASVLLPVTKRAEEGGFGGGIELLGRQATGELDRRSHLLEVRGTAVAAGQVPLEASALLRGERVLEVVRDQLDELLATELFGRFRHSSSERYSSSARLTLERARCRSTR